MSEIVSGGDQGKGQGQGGGHRQGGVHRQGGGRKHRSINVGPSKSPRAKVADPSLGRSTENQK